MGQFYISWDNFSTSISAMTAGKVYGVAGKRFEVNDITVTGAGQANPADVQHKVLFDFMTNATTGVGAFLTPVKKDQASNASAFTLSGIEFSSECAVYASSVTLFGFNQRSGMRIGVPEGYGWKTDGGQTNLSAGLRILSSSLGAVDGNLHWIEP